MGLLSIFKRQPGAVAAAAGANAVQGAADARTRAKRRLLGAVVLLGIGVIAFPLLFETQPRPIPVDIAIEIPRKDAHRRCRCRRRARCHLPQHRARCRRRP